MTEKFYAVKYKGDITTGTKTEWQIWSKKQLENADDDRRILETHELVNAHQFIELDMS